VGDLDLMFGRREHVGYLVVEEVRVVIDQEQEGHGLTPHTARRSGMSCSLYEAITKQFHA
jgi:hypothetical protein